MIIRTIHKCLQSLPGVDCVIAVQPLHHIASNQHFKVQLRRNSQQHSYFLKYLQNTHFTPLNRRVAFELQTQVAKSGLAPMPLHLFAQQHIHIEEWIDVSAGDEFGRENWIHKTAAIMAKIHQLSVQTTAIDLPAHWQRYLECIPPRHHPSLRSRIAACCDVWQTSNELCLCHHDLSFQHLASSNSDVVFDWEYAALGDPYFDLACSILNNQLSAGEIRVLLAAYVAMMPGLTATAATEKVAAMLPLARLTGQLWQLAYEHNTAVGSGKSQNHFTFNGPRV